MSGTFQDSQILTYQYGIPTSLQNTGQQWDFPNAWAPLQDLVIRGLAKSPSPQAQEVAFQLAQNWVRTNFEVYSRDSAMYEKYDISNGGQPGGGGEYEVQEGFGWTNGVVLMLLERYGDRLSSGSQTSFPAAPLPYSCPSAQPPARPPATVMGLLAPWASLNFCVSTYLLLPLHPPSSTPSQSWDCNGPQVL
ncbi:trehalase-like [Canis lupus dingo]|uniref:trehalase-like n=1 Tax=Canis lupus dingo TaxID=286419 RepID=UPI000DC665F5|nr:trehalase-like [Canis lupus dingo]